MAQVCNNNQQGEQAAPPSLGDPFNPYSETPNYSLESTPPSQMNPYATDVMQTAAAPFYQPQTAYAQPVRYKSGEGRPVLTTSSFNIICMLL